jgi:hypothetical protein
MLGDPLFKGFVAGILVCICTAWVRWTVRREIAKAFYEHNRKRHGEAS